MTTSAAETSGHQGGDGPSDPGAGDQQDAPARQGDESEGRGEGYVAAGVVDQGGAGRAVGRGPGLAPGQRGEAGAEEAGQDGGAELPGPSAIGVGSRSPSRPASKQVRAPVWQAGPSWST